ncbi:hypothetical protein AJ79_00194 [Helicocarpus griseus UAMH5409]|uniref:Tyrosinase copper-binding domain-containing protein n=1 Tax=Helicocarpus griseus UAMH5409 TaxID=1447875 RepID=A0A2B7YCJ2_9EURO|nr:hypothetical protein AJ79_00194 [Helicocarpus griseus UAMH5409]
MHIIISFIAVLLALFTQTTQAWDAVHALAAKGLTNRLLYDLKNFPGSGYRKCNWSNVAIRREWGSLSKRERKEYINAVLCLQKKEGRTPLSQVPGAKTRFDDFVATHINQTLSIHATGNFLSWHRYFTWAYEQALRNECGYKGYQPYWDWGLYAENPLNSPLFDGSDTSLSGNGEFFEHNGTQATPYMVIPPGGGGGCVMSGPFKDMKVNLGPVAPAMNGIEPNPDFFGYNPRCLRRDISVFASSGWTKTEDIETLITINQDIASFQNYMQGDFESGFLGVHTGGHYTIGGDPGGDFFTSPGDPAFYLHHGQIDRVWWIWQNQDPETRLKAVAGTRTVFNQPPSPNTTLEDPVELGVNAGAFPLGELLSTTDGPFCYIYV